MADKDEKLAEKPEGETEELIPVEEKPEIKPESEEKPAADPAAAADDIGDEDDEHEDERLGQNEDDDKDTPAKRRRQRYRDAQRRKNEALEARLATLDAAHQKLLARLATVESGHTSTVLGTLEERIAKARHDAEQALAIHAKAIDAQNGEDAALALRIREEALDDLRKLEQQHTELRTAIERPAQQPRNDLVMKHADEWIRDNASWYDPNGGNEASRIAKQVEKRLVDNGSNPGTRAHWQALTAELKVIFTEANKSQQPAADSSGRKGPPTGAQREGNGGALKANEVYVEPEFKAALIEAGIWDDPVRRNNALKERKLYLERNAQR